MRKTVLCCCLFGGWLGFVLTGTADDAASFLETRPTRVFAPGRDVASNVVEAITGDVNVQVNDTAQHGGLVTLAARNDYRGTTYVKSGMLTVDGIGRAPEPSNAGLAGDVIIGNGTFRFTGAEGVTDRDFIFLPDAALANAPGVVEVAEGGTLRVEGRVTGANDGAACFAKSGAGTLVIATRTPGAVNRFRHNSNTLGTAIALPANGDSPQVGVSCFNVIAGRVVLDLPAGVTNSFNSEVMVGGRAPTPKGAHLEVRGGVNLFHGWCAVARSSGDATTDPDNGDACTLDILGGSTTINSLGLGYCQNNGTIFNPLGIVNVSGGTLGVDLLRIDHTKSRGILNVSGGSVSLRNASIAHYNAGSAFTLNLTGGQFACTGTFDTSVKGGTTVALNLLGGTFAAARIAHTAATDTRLAASGAALKMNGDWSATEMRCGPQPATLQVSGDRTLAMPLAVRGVDGGLDVTAARLGDTLAFADAVGVTLRVADGAAVSFGGNTVTAPVVLADAATLRVTAATTLPDVRMGACGRLAFAQPAAPLTVSAWTAPDTLVVNVDAAFVAGTYDLLAFPASVDFTAERAVVANPAAGRAYAFAVRDGGTVKSLVLTVAASASTETDPVGFKTQLYPFSSFASPTVNAPITVTGTRNRQMGVDVPEGETLTFARGLVQESGGFVKLGAGTLALAGPYDYVFSKSFSQDGLLAGTEAPLARFDEAGTSLRAYAAFEVDAGTLLVGGAGQNMQVNAQELWVGSGTQTNGVQPDAAVVQTGGGVEVAATYLVVGRNPGYQKGDANTLGGRDRVNATYTLRDGSLTVNSFICGYDNGAGAPQRAVFEMFGGCFRQSNAADRSFRVGATDRHPGVSEAAFVMHGGTADIAALAYFPLTTMACCMSLSDGAEMNLRGGIRFARKTTPGVFAITNATLRFAGDLWGADNHTLILDGATLVPGARAGDVELRNFGSFVYGAGGLTVDTSALTSGWFNVRHVLDGAGPLTVRGTDIGRSVCLRDVGDHACPVTVEAGGALAVENQSAGGCAVTVRNGGALWNAGDGTAPSALASLTLGDDADSVTYLRGTSFGAGRQYGFAPQALAVRGTVYVALRQNGTADLCDTFSGRIQILTAPRGTLAPAQFKLDPRLAANGVTGTFTVEGEEDGRDTLWYEAVGAADHTHVWSAEGGGAWSEAANWQDGAVPEDVSGDPVAFPAGLARAAQVDLGGAVRTVGTVVSHAAADVALVNGTLRLPAGGASLASTGGGTLALPALVGGPDPLGNGLALSGRVALMGALTGITSVKAADGATLACAPRALGSVPVSLGNAWLRPVADGLVSGPVTATGSGLFVDVPEGVSAGLDNLDNAKPFVKVGAGTLTLTGAGTFRLGKGALGDINANDQAFAFPTNGTTPTTGSPTVGLYGGRLILGRDGQTVNCEGSEFWVGGHPVMEADGTTADVRLDVCGGTLNVPNYFGIGRTRADLPTADGLLTRRPTYAFNLYAGDVTVRQFLMNYCPSLKQCVRSEANIYGGTFTVTGDRFAVCQHGSAVTIDGKGNEAVFNQHGGVVSVQGADVWVTGYGNQGGAGELNLFGGTFDAQDRTVASRPTQAGRDRGVIRLAGGTLKAKRLCRTGGAGTATLVLNGGTFIPTSDADLSGFDVCYASTNATVLDVSAVASHTLDQEIAHDAALGEVADGGLVKRGAGRLLVKRALAFTGPFGVYAGVVDLDGAADFPLHALAGSGSVTNGTLRIACTVEPRPDPAEQAGTDPVALTVDALAFEAGATWKVRVLDAAAGRAHRLAVTETLSAAGVVTVDFGRTAGDPLPTSFSALIGTVGRIEGRLAFTCVNTGFATGGHRVVVSLRDGHELVAHAVASGTCILVR